METFLTKQGDTFEWRQPEPRARQYELLRQGEVFGTLEFRNAFGSLAWSTDPVQRWTFKRVGFFSPHVTVRMPDSESDYAVFEPRLLGGGALHTPDGRPITWEPLNFWRTQWRFADKSGNSILHYQQGSEDFKLKEIFKLQAEMVVETSRITNLEFSMLANLGFYLMALYAEDAAVAATAAAA